ncbi:Microfibril-associated glycoprotein 4 [Labeo rohita]|uniref:Microfibril-associated glycoprotein 4 n=1 Tax=Labeo rohita TaxID=84645 RepID=A0ABQ8M1A2_LABRO|nr:microfibril-associated glycoprotein 4 isoform X1 [Labeo rohita]XP_050983081.1 microfibril-associated glycoprotein 4 isoform X2 [Labeo rohita]KAI2656687.1 Microfibril-associated glycoprotein 4 [Labeo rohita]
MITNMIVLLCLSALFPVLMGTDDVKAECILARDCSDIYSRGNNLSGVYTITTIDGPQQVYCEMVSGGKNDQGHWTVFLRRMDGEVNFFRPWESYKWGFGNKKGEYWLGLEFLHQLTSRHRYKLRVDLEDFEGKKAYSVYESFSVDGEADGYKLHVSGYVDGGAGQTFGYHNGMKFSTFDKDNSGLKCSIKYSQGGFWYKDCDYANPTGLYWWGKDDGSLKSGPFWYYWKSNNKSLKAVTMKITRVK